MRSSHVYFAFIILYPDSLALEFTIQTGLGEGGFEKACGSSESFGDTGKNLAVSDRGAR